MRLLTRHLEYGIPDLPSAPVVTVWNDVQEMRRSKVLREWLGITHEQFEQYGVAWLEWAEQFRRIEMGEVGDG